MLSAAQQSYATQAVELVGPCISYFLRNYPCLRGVVDSEELESAALFACAQAATTYDPGKAGISAYFSRAIIHELLKSCRREIRSGYRSPYRLSVEQAEQRQPVRQEPLADAAMSSLADLSETDQEWICSYALEEVSVRHLARVSGVSARRATKLLSLRLSRLRKATLDHPHVRGQGQE